jgi:hypothetical protein
MIGDSIVTVAAEDADEAEGRVTEEGGVPSRQAIARSGARNLRVHRVLRG